MDLIGARRQAHENMHDGYFTATPAYCVPCHGRHRSGECRAVKESIRQRLEKLTDRFEEVGRLLATADIAGGSQQFRDLSMEYARLQPLAEGYRGYHNLERDLAAAQEMLADADPDMRSLGAEEVGRVGLHIAAAEADLRKLLVPKDPRDDKNIFLEIRAGTGGDEAAIFAG